MPINNARVTRSSSRLQSKVSAQATKTELEKERRREQRPARNARRQVIVLQSSSESDSDFSETRNNRKEDLEMRSKRIEDSDFLETWNKRKEDSDLLNNKRKEDSDFLEIRNKRKEGTDFLETRSKEDSDFLEIRNKRKEGSDFSKTRNKRKEDSDFLETRSKDESNETRNKSKDDSDFLEEGNKRKDDKTEDGEETSSISKDDKQKTEVGEDNKLRLENNAISPRKKKSLDVENCCVTPPKQRRSEAPLFSPSSLLAKLDLNASPSKPHAEPKNLFDAPPTTYQSARKALHSTVPVQMPGREREHEELRSFLRENLAGRTSATLYVSGPPGTGKTASLSTILQQPDILSQFKEVYVNCTAIKSSGAIYARIVKELGLRCSGKTEKDYVAAIEAHLCKNHKMILLVLDEIDQLESKKQSVLYKIFEWPSLKDSKLLLIGIANALDLTDRILPRLQARCELKPRLMHFAPYSKQQIVEIFTDRLRQAGVLELFSPVALQMLAGKVAAVSGDVRRALDIGRRVVEMVESNKALQPLENESKAKTVDLKHVVGVLNSVYGTSTRLDEDEDAFPLQQKILVCTLLLVLKKAKNKDVNVGKLHEIYRKVCSKRNLLAVDQAEFAGLCSLVETKGIIRVSGRKEPRLHKVTLEWDEEEVAAALKDKQLMSLILQDVSVLGKL